MISIEDIHNIHNALVTPRSSSYHGIDNCRASSECVRELTDIAWRHCYNTVVVFSDKITIIAMQLTPSPTHSHTRTGMLRPRGADPYGRRAADSSMM